MRWEYITDILFLMKTTCHVKFEVFTVMKIQVTVLWVVMQYSNVVGYQHSGQPCCLHLYCEIGNQVVLVLWFFF